MQEEFVLFYLLPRFSTLFSRQGKNPGVFVAANCIRG